jgi:flagellar biosynthesis protein FlhA
MTDTTGPEKSGGRGGLPADVRLPSLSEALSFLKRGDTAMALGVMAILVVLILPMPPMILDLLLAVSIIFSVLVLMTALFIRKALEFSAFPTVLLIATMLRLSLNLASTRLILSNGHEGTDAAGAVIEAFGYFVMGGNFVIGIIVFAILVMVNFIVITKGSGRIAEVAARFTLDAMPGKQMAVDADLSAGLINEDEARARRRELEDESSFYGAMDGASKFVRGDAIAGLLITFINVIGGIIIGMGQMGLSFSEAGQAYTLLTVGDGLVSQIPALIVSTAAGLLVSKAGISEGSDQAVIKQLGSYPKALGMTSAAMIVMGLLPGIPALPFMALGLGAGAMAFFANRDQMQQIEEAEVAQVAAQEPAQPVEEPISSALAMDDLKIEIGYAILSLVNSPGNEGNDRLTEQIKALRRQLAQDMGFVMPPVRVLDNVQLEANDYIVKIKEVDAGRGIVYPNQVMVMDPAGGQIELPGFHTTEPTFGLPASWVDETLRDQAAMKGYTVVDPATVISTHLTEVVKNNMAELLSYADVTKLLNELPSEQQKLVDDLIPGQISMSGVQRILQGLLIERISIRDLPTILEGIAEGAALNRSARWIGEHVRQRLCRQICAQHTSPNGYLPIVTLAPEWEQNFGQALVGDGDDKQLAMAPSKLQDFVHKVSEAFESAAKQGEIPVLLSSAGNRPHVRTIVERFRPQTVVMSQSEIHPRAKLKTLGSI